MPVNVIRPLLETAHAAAAAGLVIGSVGNLSIRDGDTFIISASGARLDTLSERELTTLALADGRVVAGALRPSSEHSLHQAIYRERPEAGAILHTHAPWSTAIACVLEELPCIHYQMLALGGAVRVAPYRLFGTPELAAVTVAALHGRHAVLMSNHGATTLAETPAAAFEAMQVLEFACTVYWRAAQLGTPRTLNAEQWREVEAHVRALGYGTTHPRGTG
ncbi:MAG: class II aldolase/adducin family protein [Nevskiaceae bacterium]|nr:MAG: class II aldolase/adducin family protein [Nevskiaceae bacterium]TBR72261.1 MAG: class II aldolase/adducin family protein [Nevskiaceae bacterium]